MSKDVEYCNWTFLECLKPKQKWLIYRDCEDKPTTLSRSGGKNWTAYKASLQPQIQLRYPYIRPGSECPNCGKGVNGVDPGDDGQTWRK